MGENRDMAASEASLGLIIEVSPDALIMLSKAGIILFANPAAERLLERPVTALIGTEFGFPVTGVETTEIEVLSTNGEFRIAEMRLVEIEWKGEKAVLLALRDITERRAGEQALRFSEEKLAKVFQASPDWLSITTFEEGHHLDVNDAFVFTTGYTREEVIGKSAEELGLWINPEVLAIASKRLQKHGSLHDYEVNLRMKSGRIYAMLWSAQKIDLKGQPCLVNAFKDITARKELEKEVNRIAFHDQLTGLPNRMLLLDRLKLATFQADRTRLKVALMMLDLDRFKDVNDTFGHQTGDKLLQAATDKLTKILRKVDTAARFGGDEFVLVLTMQKGAEGALLVASKIIAAFRTPILLDGHSLTITCSIGIALYPDHGADIDTLLKNADSAMYQAKQSGRSQHHLYVAHGSAGGQ